ncbi:MAG: NUDIX domain-containing protein [Magnetococcales bacterium]|nr:NUDIX domain-containing protein [Magnetococcales bacterium]
MIIRPAGILVDDGRILTMRYQYSGRDRFNLPGGNHEDGEELRVVLVREFAEELGVDVVVGDLIFMAETLVAQREVLHLLFAITSFDGEAKINSEETKAEELVWLDKKSLLDAPLYPAIGVELAKFIVGEQPTKTHLGRINQEWIA